MVYLRSLIAFAVLALPFGASAQGLSPAECTELRAEYGLVGPGCASDAPAAPTSPTKSTPQAADKENNIFFTRGGTELDEAAQAQLDLLARVLSIAPLQSACIRVVGHSDASGSANVNLDISLQRAVTVAKYLTTALGDPMRIGEIDAVGEDDLLLPSSPNDGHNRRVELQARRCPHMAG